MKKRRNEWIFLSDFFNYIFYSKNTILVLFTGVGNLTTWLVRIQQVISKWANTSTGRILAERGLKTHVF